MSVHISEQAQSYTIRIEGNQSAQQILTSVLAVDCGDAWRACLINAIEAHGQQSDAAELPAIFQVIENVFGETITSDVRPIAIVPPDNKSASRPIYEALFNMLSYYFEWGIPEEHRFIRMFNSVNDANYWISQPITSISGYSPHQT